MDSYNSEKDYLADLETISFENTLIAYVRPVTTDTGTGYAVCSADGTQLATFSTKDAAWFAAKQHDLEPVYLH